MALQCFDKDCAVACMRVLLKSCALQRDKAELLCSPGGLSSVNAAPENWKAMKILLFT